MESEFEKKLSEFGFTYQYKPEGHYILNLKVIINSIIKVYLICSENVDEIKFGSRNGNLIESIGRFKFKFDAEMINSDFVIFAFQNTKRNLIDFVIIPSNELKKRIMKGDWIHPANHIWEKVYWLMPDNCLYEATNISIEGEWYYLSQGLNGRMIDGTEWDYTEYLNGWDRLVMT
jgi:hypothetical protein